MRLRRERAIAAFGLALVILGIVAVVVQLASRDLTLGRSGAAALAIAGVAAIALGVLGNRMLLAAAERERAGRQERERYARDLEATLAALRETEERYALLADGIHDGVVLMTEDGRVVECNRSAERILRLSRNEIVGHPWKDVTSRLVTTTGEPYPESQRPMTLALRTGEPQHDVLLGIRHDSGITWLSVNAHVETREHDGHVERFAVASFTDITDRREARALLERERETLRRVLEGLSDGVIAVDASGLITVFNNPAREILGLPLSPEPAPKTIGDLRRLADIFADDGLTRVNADQLPFTRALKGETVRDMELRVGARGRPKRVVLAGARPLTGSDGSVRGAVLALRDVTERRLLEEQLRQTQKMDAIGRLASGIAHDFNNVLTVIASYSELLVEGSEPDDPRRADALEIRRAAEHAAELTRQLLAFSRPTPTSRRLANPTTLVERMSGMLGRLLGPEIELVTRTRPDTPPVEMEPGQLEQIVMNLAVNARDAMPNGGVLVIEYDAVNIDESAARLVPRLEPGLHGRLVVADTGIGMDEETRAQIFEPFFTTKPAGQGTGLGLATVYGIVAGAKGGIAVESQRGRGTRFEVYLPAAAGAD